MGQRVWPVAAALLAMSVTYSECTSSDTVAVIAFLDPEDRIVETNHSIVLNTTVSDESVIEKLTETFGACFRLLFVLGFWYPSFKTSFNTCF